MEAKKIIRGVINATKYTVTAPVVKEDYGLYLLIEGADLPAVYEVDFSNSENSGSSVTMVGNADGVLIPRQFIKSGQDVFAFLYLNGEDFGRTVYKFRIPNKLRPDRTEEQPTPEEQSVIDQTISALNDAVESAQGAQQAIENMSVSAETLTEGSTATVTKTEQDGVVHLAFGIPKGQTGLKGDKGDKGDRGEQGIQGIQGERGLTGAKGDKGDKGDTGATGTQGPKGNDGYSPSASVSKSGTVTTITITDKNGTTTATVNDGANGQNGTNGTNGTNGADGTTFTPSVSSAGVISWTNDGNKQNPSSVDLVAAIPEATTQAAGKMSATDKDRLDTLYADYSSALTALGVS